MMEPAETMAFAGVPASELLRFRLIMGVSFDLEAGLSVGGKAHCTYCV